MNTYNNKSESPQRRVLIADDLPLNRMCLKTFLTAENLSISEASDGMDALELLEHGHFDLAIIDLEMPGMKGDEVMARHRASHAGGTPIIIVTTDPSQETKKWLQESGAASVIDRPITLETIRQILFSCFKHENRLTSLPSF